MRFEITPVGRVESPLTNLASAPKQGDEGAPEAWLVFEPAVLEALGGIREGDELIVHPRGDESRPQQGVFSTRSPHRPNPIGLHPVQVESIHGARVRVRNLEAVDGTPIIDVKPVIGTEIRGR